MTKTYEDTSQYNTEKVYMVNSNRISPEGSPRIKQRVVASNRFKYATTHLKKNVIEQSTKNAAVQNHYASRLQGKVWGVGSPIRGLLTNGSPTTKRTTITTPGRPAQKQPIKVFQNNRKSMSYLKTSPITNQEPSMANITLDDQQASNKLAMTNAVQYGSFGGTLSPADLRQNKKELSEIISHMDPNKHLIALLKPNKFNTRLDLKALYAVELPDSGILDTTISDRQLTKVWGKTTPNQPQLLDMSLVQKFYRFNQQTKQFVEILGLKQIGATTDGIQIW